MENLCGVLVSTLHRQTMPLFSLGRAEHICTTARKWSSYFYTFRLLDRDMWIVDYSNCIVFRFYNITCFTIYLSVWSVVKNETQYFDDVEAGSTNTNEKCCRECSHCSRGRGAISLSTRTHALDIIYISTQEMSTGLREILRCPEKAPARAKVPTSAVKNPLLIKTL